MEALCRPQRKTRLENKKNPEMVRVEIMQG